MKSDNKTYERLDELDRRIMKHIEEYKNERKKIAYGQETNAIEFVGFILALFGIIMMIFALFSFAIFHDFLTGIINFVMGLIFSQLCIDFYFIARIRKMYMEFREKK